MRTKAQFQRIGLCGTGRVACAMGLALRDCSMQPVLFWGRDRRKAQELAERTGGEVAGNLARLAGDCDLIVLAVSDDALMDVAADLAHVLPPSPSLFIFHVSGRSGLASLAPLAAKGARVAAIHPAMTFTGNAPAEMQRMVGARFAVTTAETETAALARDLVQAVGGVAVEVADAQRVLYHAALCHAANHLVTLMAGSLDMLDRAGIADGAAVLAPLVRAALENSLAQGMDALSGPLLRGDSRTVEGHRAALARDCPEMLPVYRAMALATLEALERKGITPSPAMQDALGLTR